MKFNDILEEIQNNKKLLICSYSRYKLKYIGTREDYKIRDSNPYVLALDDNYNVDGKGISLLGINLNYYKGHHPSLINDINKNDNKAGFRGFNLKEKIKGKLSKDKEKFKKFIKEKKEFLLV